MKYTIEIPTIEALETLTVTAHRKGQHWILNNISSEMENRATLGFENYTQNLEKCPYVIDQCDVNEIQNTLREMGFQTYHYPRKEQLVVDWSIKARKELQANKDNNCAWRFPTREESMQRQKELEAIITGKKAIS